MSRREIILGGRTNESVTPPIFSVFDNLNLSEVTSIIYYPGALFADLDFDSWKQLEAKISLPDAEFAQLRVQGALKRLMGWVERGGKGILVVNSYRDIPVFDRETDTFPQNLVDYLKLNDMCGMTTAQLLAICLEARSDPKIADKAITAILGTHGVLPGFSLEQWLQAIDLNK